MAKCIIYIQGSAGWFDFRRSLYHSIALAAVSAAKAPPPAQWPQTLATPPDSAETAPCSVLYRLYPLWHKCVRCDDLADLDTIVPM